MHLADAFIQSDLHCIQVSTFYQLLLSLGIEPMILALLAPCSTSWATRKLMGNAAYPSTYLLGAGITGPKVELKVLESEKDSFKGIWPSTWSLGPGRSLRGYHLLCTSLLRELSQQTSW